MSDFLGKRVKIEAKDFVVEGVVFSIEQGHLVLEDVTSKSTGEHLEKMIVMAIDILNVLVLEAKKPSKKKKKASPAPEPQLASQLQASSQPRPASAPAQAPPQASVQPPKAALQAPQASAPSQPINLASRKQQVPRCTALQLSQMIAHMLEKGYSPFTVAERAAEGLEAIIRARASSGHLVFLVGSHCVGEWAIAAARRLAADHKVVVVSPNKNAVQALESQTKPLIAAGGLFVATQNALFAALENNPPSLVVDALAGFESTLVDQLDQEEHAAAQWLLEWSKRASLSVSVCTPSKQSDLLVSCGFPIDQPAVKDHVLVNIGVTDTILSQLKLTRLCGINFGSAFIQI